MKHIEIRELKVRKKDFQMILKALILWEKENLKKDTIGLKVRKILSDIPADDLMISMLKLEEAVFYVVVKYQSNECEISTSWIHEDDVYKERLFHANNKNHISHKVTCLTDLFEVSEIIPETDTRKIA